MEKRLEETSELTTCFRESRCVVCPQINDRVNRGGGGGVGGHFHREYFFQNRIINIMITYASPSFRSSWYKFIIVHYPLKQKFQLKLSISVESKNTFVLAFVKNL